MGLALALAPILPLPSPSLPPLPAVVVPSPPLTLPAALPTAPPTVLPSALPTALPSALPTPAPPPAPPPAPVSAPTPPVPAPAAQDPPPTVGYLTSPPPDAGPAVTMRPVAGVHAAPTSGVSSKSVRLGIGDLVLPAGPAGIRLAVGLLAVPALLVLWLLLAARTGALAVARRTRGSRAALAAQLGLPAEQLRGVDAIGLRKLRDRVAVDEVTGVASRAAGTAALEREAARARRQGAELSVLFVDVDGLKAVNDAHGHGAGDRLLKGVAETLAGRLRAQDLVFRYGGDEFVCVLPDTPEPEATRVAGEIRKAAGRARAFSYGVAALEVGENVDALLARADARQYRDKRTRHAGRPNGPSGSG